MSTQVHSARGHCELSPSAASRWMACPGSVALNRRLPKTPSSFYAEEGTAAHEMGEECLRSKKDPQDLLGEFWTDGEGTKHEIDQEMVDAIQTYVDYIRGLLAGACVWYSIERQFFLDAINPPAPMYGTADFVGIVGDALEVVDYKHGKGVAVEVPENKQLMYYALGAYISIPQEMLPHIRRVRITVIQPRAYHAAGPIRSWELSTLDLLDYAMDLFAMAEVALAPGAPLSTGDHCRWCAAKGVCPEATNRAVAIAKGEFKVLQDKPAPPEATLLTPEQLADFLPKFDAVEAWMKGVREHAYNLLMKGTPVPGYKLVDKRATRKWADENEVEKWILAAGHNPGKLHETSLLSPAKAEKVLGKKNPIPADLISKVSSGYTMTEASDNRPAANIIAAANEFAVVDANSIL